MRYLPLSEADRSAMLAKIGASSVDELFRDVPEGLLLNKPIEGLPLHASEMAVERELSDLARKNMVAGDVPFFLGPGTALALGRGEILTPVRPPRRPLQVVVVVPKVRVSTREAYANHLIPKSRLTGWTDAVNLVQLRAFRLSRGVSPKALFNDLEGSVLRRHPAIRAVRDRLLKNGAAVALMSGSGSGVVGFTSGSTPPRVVAARLSRIDGKVFVARSVRAGSNSCRERPRVSGKTPYRHTL